MGSPTALAIALVVALTYYAGMEVVRGVTGVGHEAHRAGAAIVHVLKKVPHPRKADDDPR
jgi:hypothetical protein